MTLTTSRLTWTGVVQGWDEAWQNIIVPWCRADVQETLGAKGHWTSCNMLANKFYIADFMKNYHQEIANLLDNGLDVGFFMTFCTWKHKYLLSTQYLHFYTVSTEYLPTTYTGPDLRRGCWLHLQLAGQQEVGQGSGVERQGGVQHGRGRALDPHHR